MGRKRKVTLLIVGLLSMISTVFSALLPVRLDIYDASDNHLMFVEFKYENGRNTERIVYMSDSTFVRRVYIRYRQDGSRKEELSYNFNEDTSFILTYKDGGFTVESYINRAEDLKENRLDYVGGAVRWETLDNLNFNLFYNVDNSLAAIMNYEADESGNLVRVRIKDPLSEDEYVGVFTNEEVSVKQPYIGNQRLNYFDLKRSGGGIIEFEVNLTNKKEVSCELIGLNGVKVRTLFKEGLKEGNYKKTIRIGRGNEKLPNGVYVLIFKIDGKVIMKSRYLHQYVGIVEGGAR
ncbi:MAG: hypothetical protein N2053_11365 [Chitinispirillaceae bacterium]|nr:hypothetical protein [Chitinispirillaceae bacterium]